MGVEFSRGLHQAISLTLVRPQVQEFCTFPRSFARAGVPVRSAQRRDSCRMGRRAWLHEAASTCFGFSVEGRDKGAGASGAGLVPNLSLHPCSLSPALSQQLQGLHHSSRPATVGTLASSGSEPPRSSVGKGLARGQASSAHPRSPFREFFLEYSLSINPSSSIVS